MQTERVGEIFRQIIIWTLVWMGLLFTVAMIAWHAGSAPVDPPKNKVPHVRR